MHHFRQQLRQQQPLAIPLRVSLAIMLLLLLLLLWSKWLRTLLDTTGFEPHGYCYLWLPGLVTLHVSSDALIGLAYVSISSTLLYFVVKTRHDVPFQWIFVAFGVFIVACGATHFMEIVTLWDALYWFSGVVKVVTAVASVATAVALPLQIPKVMALISAAKVSEARKRQLEQAHQELERLYEKGQELDRLKAQFFANVSHELRTPLTLILGPTRHLLSQGNPPRQQRDELEVIERNALTLLKQVNDLLDIAKIDAGQMRLHCAPVDLAHLLRFSLAHFEQFARERGIAVAAEFPSSLPAQADAEKIQRICLNVLSNAFKFTPAGGSVRCGLRQEGERVLITVQDTGPGVKPELRQRIFERFSRAEEAAASHLGGTGLGLAIAKEFVDLHAGTVTVTDAASGGALFTIDLPLDAPAVLASDAMPTREAEELPWHPMPQPFLDESTEADQPAQHGADPAHPLVLVIEDNRDMLQFIATTLHAEYRVATARNGQDGLRQASLLHPDLILCDVMMPVMSGYQFVRHLRSLEAFGAVPVMALSALADAPSRVHLLQEGVQDYLVKPFFSEELQARVANLLKLARTRQLLQCELASQNQDIVALAAQLADRRRESEELLSRLRQSEERKDFFLSMAGHELKTPITSLKAYAQLLGRFLSQAERAREAHYCAKMEQQIDRLVGLIDELLDVSRIQVGQLALTREPCEVDGFVRECVELVQQTSARHTICLSGATGKTLHVDKVRLGQVLTNLLSNAMKYSPTAERVEVIVAAEHDRVIISVRDQGIGILREHQARIFERFYRVSTQEDQKFPGLGVGLYIAAEIIKRHGGTMWVESVEGQGSTFSFSLPIVTGSTGDSTSPGNEEGVVG